VQPAFSTLLSPGFHRDVVHLAHGLGVRYAAAYETVSPSSDPPQGGGRVATDQHLRSALLRRGRPYRTAVHRLAGPDAPHKVQLLFEPAAPVFIGGRGRAEVVLPGPDAEPKGEAAPESASMVAACLASKAASRTGAISTEVINRTRSVTAAAAASVARGS
jgi:hypothetical protein